MAKQKFDHGLPGMIYVILGERDPNTQRVKVIAKGQVLRPIGTNLHMVHFFFPTHFRVLPNDALSEGLLFENEEQINHFIAAINPPVLKPVEAPAPAPAPVTVDPVENLDLPDGTDEAESSVAADVATD